MALNQPVSGEQGQPLPRIPDMAAHDLGDRAPRLKPRYVAFGWCADYLGKLDDWQLQREQGLTAAARLIFGIQ